MHKLSTLLLALLMLSTFSALASDKAISQKLKIVIPKVKFDGQSVTDAFAFVQKMSREQDQDKKGVNIVLLADAKESRIKIKLDADNMPVAEIIKYICLQSNLSYKVDQYAIVIGNKAIVGHMDTKFYLAQNKVISIIDQSFKGDTEAFLKQIGIKFPPGAKVTLVRSMNRLVLTNTKDAHKKMASLLKPL